MSLKYARFSLVAILMLACVGCDQVTKHAVREHLALGESHSFAGDVFRLTHAENPGAFLSIGASLSAETRVAVFQVGVSLLTLGLLGYALFGRRLDRWEVIGFALLAASGLGNLIDRITRDGHVTDFLNLGLGSIRTGIFNVADIAGVVGVAMLVARHLRTTRHAPNP